MAADKTILAELITLITYGELEAAEVDAQVKEVIDGQKQILTDSRNAAVEFGGQDMGWTEDDFLCVSLSITLDGYFAVSDKIDELHEQLQDLFPHELPDFPEEFWDESTDKYFTWLALLLKQHEKEVGGYSLLFFEGSMDDNLHAVIVYSRDVARIIAVAATLGLKVVPAESH